MRALKIESNFLTFKKIIMKLVNLQNFVILMTLGKGSEEYSIDCAKTFDHALSFLYPSEVPTMTIVEDFITTDKDAPQFSVQPFNDAGIPIICKASYGMMAVLETSNGKPYVSRFISWGIKEIGIYRLKKRLRNL